MLSLYEFSLLAEQQQFHYVFNECTFLASHVEDEIFTACLYHAPGPPKTSFFIEVWYNVADNKIDSLRTFRALRLLEPYLNGLDISKLL